MTFESEIKFAAKSTVGHYENFPVASFLLPARLRPAVRAIYAFARSADDLADEGDATIAERLASLASYESALEQIAQGKAATDPIFRALADTIRAHHLPMQAFHDLLSAFRQDVATTRYEDYDQLLDYCKRSANPVGLLMLHLYEMADERNVRDSDAICTALQLINFWQDVAIDWRKARIYLAQDDMARFGVTESHIARQEADHAWRALMQHQVRRTRALMLSGAPLARRLPGRIGWELRLIVQGGLRILERIEAVDYDVFRHRPELAGRDWLLMAVRAARMR